MLLRIMAEVSGFDVGQSQTLSIAIIKECVRRTEGMILTAGNGSTQGETCPIANLFITNPTRKGLELNKDQCYEWCTTHHFPKILILCFRAS